jgi:hypothetical protein
VVRAAHPEENDQLIAELSGGGNPADPADADPEAKTG